MAHRILPVFVAFLAGFSPLATAQNQLATPQSVKDDPVTPYLGIGPCTQGTTSMLIDLDASFSVVVFDGFGGSGPANPADPCQRNDDDITFAVPLQFTFDLFGQTYNQVFINNNGNVSFGAGFATYTSTGFPVNGYPMVAPFWADVDTRNLGSGVVWYRSEPTRFTVIWDHVGYFSQQAGLLNTFELILTDGNDPLIGVGNNVAFCYDNMDWTTGSASGGSGGFGGTPATAGVNRGDGVNFFQIGRFNAPGTQYDGPGGASDGVDYLDDTCYSFSVGQVGTNVPPVFLNPPSACLQTTVGTPLQFSLQAIGPENNQTVTLSVNSGGLSNFSAVSIPGNPATSNCTYIAAANEVGFHQVVFTATDDGATPANAQLSVCIEVLPFVTSYCTPGTSINGCVPTLSHSGAPSVAANSGFVVTMGGADGGRICGMFYGLTPLNQPYGSGTARLCAGAPRQRFFNPLTLTGGTVGACDGALAIDVLAYLSAHPASLGMPFQPGNTLYIQGWNRDNGNGGWNLSTSDGLRVEFLP